MVLLTVRRTLLAVGAVLLLGAAGPPGEYDVKAAFLYNFTSFVTWPDDAFEDPGAPFVIGILGPDPFDDALEEAFEGRRVQGRRVLVRRWEEASEVSRAHMLFVAEDREDRLRRMLREVSGRGTLTVGDVPGFAARGGCIGFKLEERRVRFEINLEATREAGLRVSSELAKLATIVPGGRP